MLAANVDRYKGYACSQVFILQITIILAIIQIHGIERQFRGEIMGKMNTVFSELLAILTDLSRRSEQGGGKLGGISYEEIHLSIQNLLDLVNTYYKDYIDFEFIVDNMVDSVSITNANGELIYVNKAWTAQNHMAPEEVLGKTMSHLTKTTGYGESVVDQVLRTGAPQIILSNSLAYDPALAGHSIGCPLFGNDGKLKYVVASLRPLSKLASLGSDFAFFVNEITTIQRNITSSYNVLNASSDVDHRKIISKSDSMEEIFSLVQRVAPTDATILIQGESGSGKEVVADEIYRLSSRAGKPFVKVNCASIPATLIESELFGYEKGAFSGANSAGKKGLFEMANGGTILLDEIGEMPMDLQAKLLRTLQDNAITKVGGTKLIKLDVRVIASTNADLQKMLDAGTFRLDLFYRLNVVPIHIPPLRDRISDIPALCEHFQRVFQDKYNQSVTLTDSQMGLLQSYPWPGNVRELQNLMEFLTICYPDNTITDDTLRGLLSTSSRTVKREPSDDSSEIPVQPGDLNQRLELYERSIIEDTLKTAITLKDASEILGIDASTLSRKLKKLNIDFRTRHKQ